MKKSILFLYFCAFILPCFFSSQVHAYDYPWRGAEMQLKIGSELELYPKNLSLNAHFVYFAVPANNVQMYFTYMGAKWNVTDWFWVKPMLGFAGNWISGDAFDAALYMGSTLFGGRITIVSESDLLINDEGVDYYSYYTGDLHFFRFFHIGLHLENINKGIMVGPHIGVTKSIDGKISLSGEIQYYAGFQDINRGQAIRVFVGFDF